MSDILKNLAQKIERIEERVSRLESFKVILDERKVLAREGEFEGKTYLSNQNGSIFKEIRVGYCDVCGRKPERFNACSSCKRKLCEECSLNFNNRIYCFDCLNDVISLTKEEFKILLAIESEIKPELLERISRIRREEIREILRSLEEKGLIERKGILLFKEIKLLEKGLEAIIAYRQIYGRLEDVRIFEEEARRSSIEKY